MRSLKIGIERGTTFSNVQKYELFSHGGNILQKTSTRTAKILNMGRPLTFYYSPDECVYPLVTKDVSFCPYQNIA